MTIGIVTNSNPVNAVLGDHLATIVVRGLTFPIIITDGDLPGVGTVVNGRVAGYGSVGTECLIYSANFDVRDGCAYDADRVPAVVRAIVDVPDAYGDIIPTVCDFVYFDGIGFVCHRDGNLCSFILDI